MANTRFDVLDPSVRNNVYTQKYDEEPGIDGVKIIQLKNATGEDSDFSELMRIDEQGKSEVFPDFSIRQINRSTQLPGSIKAWHLHLVQDEVWYVPDEARIMAVLWDVRKDSSTNGKTMRIAMGGSSHRTVYIPHGVAHGSANISTNVGIIIYFVNQQFDKSNPDEHRIPWDAMGTEIWKPLRD